MGTAAASRKLVDVAVPAPVDKLFTYRVPDALAGRVQVGCRVQIPFGKRRVTGYVVRARSRLNAAVRLRDIAALVDEEPLITPALLDAARWMADYYVHPLGEVLRAVLPAGVKGTGRIPPPDAGEDTFPPEIERPLLTPDQHAAFVAVREALAAGGGGRFLVHGITGSGKTEVYLRAIAEAIERGKSAIVLIPEIALIPQTVARFRRRFGGKVAVLHSRITGAQRAAIWRGARTGAVSVVVGARSAVFVPVANLGIIVVDEEQDASFKQEDKPRYHAVRVARFRAEREGAVLLMGSATPALETYEAARGGEIGLLELRSRPGGLALPRVEIVDMRGRREILSEELLTALERCLERREQAVILLNRRGHANFVQCRECGWIEYCPNCSIPVTFHGRGQKLLCHYCGFREAVPEACPRCGAYKVVHRGIGTERVEMELANLLPGIRIARMDLDTTAGRRGHLAVLERFARGERDVLLGTQMVAKGHHYPSVTVIGVIAADRGLQFPDFRAAEKTFRLLFQAAGRTGRGTKGGLVIVQTRAPEHFLFGHLARHDYEGFAEAELDMRRALGYPPAGSIALFTVAARARERAAAAADSVREALAERLGGGAAVLGPTPALIERLKKRWRFQLLVKGDLPKALRRGAVEAARARVDDERAVDVTWDFDPVAFS
jgi:primosomal protein N' (replication factor Y)